MLVVKRIAELQGVDPEWHDMESAPESSSVSQPPMTMLKIRGGGGRKSKIRAGDVLGALTGELVGIDKTDVGKITVSEHATFVAVAKDVAHEAAQLRRVKGKPVRVVVL